MTTTHSPSSFRQYTFLATGFAASALPSSAALTVFDNGGAGWHAIDHQIFRGSEVSDGSGIFRANYFLGSSPYGDDFGFAIDEESGVGRLKIGTDHGAAIGVTDGMTINSGTSFEGIAKFSLEDGSLDERILGIAISEDLDDSQIHYGWIELETTWDSVNDEFDLSINRIVINDVAGQGATVSTVPEPTSSMLLLMGAAGLASRRKRVA